MSLEPGRVASSPFPEPVRAPFPEPPDVPVTPAYGIGPVGAARRPGRRQVEQRWVRPVLVHWRVEADRLVPHLPPQLVPQAHDGSAWLTLLSVELGHARTLGVRVPGLRPGAPMVAVRTYVEGPAGPGVHVFSLDVPGELTAALGRRTHGLPVRAVTLRREATDDAVTTVLADRVAGRAALRVRTTGPAMPALPGSLEAFVVDRPLGYVLRRGRLQVVDALGGPTALAPAALELAEVGLAGVLGLRGPDEAVAHTAPDVDIRFGYPRRVDAPR